MKNNNEKLVYSLRILISALFFLSAFAKLYPTPLYGITKVFEQGQLIPMGFSAEASAFLSRFIIGAEFFLAFTILFNNFLKKVILPISFLMISVFSIHLSTQIFGPAENCGCFGELIPMTPVEALIKNIITLLILAYIYYKSDHIKVDFSRLIILFLLITTLMFALLPITNTNQSNENSFISYVDDEKFRNLDDKKILCFFDAGCEHCQEAARELDSLSVLIDDFPRLHIIFSDAEDYNIPNFFEFVGNEYPYQVIPFANYDTDEVDSYMEITFPDYDNPVIIFYDGFRQLRLYEGTGDRSFEADDLHRILSTSK